MKERKKMSFMAGWKSKYTENDSESTNSTIGNELEKQSSKKSFFKGWNSMSKRDMTEAEEQTNIEDKDIIKDANHYLTDNANVARKLSDLGNRLKEKGSVGNMAKMSPFSLVSCLAAAAHFYKAINESHPEIRNNLYKESNREHFEKKELEKCSEWLDYADLAYENKYDTLRKKLKKHNFTLMRHDTSAATGRVAHFIALNPERKIGLISLKGTSTLSDVLTDALGNPIEISLENSFHPNYKSEKITCHEGIYTAAAMMADDTMDIVEHLFMPLNYKIIICGHSLGAGTACLLGLLLRSRIPSMNKNYPLLVFAYAPPPVLNYDACIASASFTTSIVNDTDMVPRMSIPNLWVMDKILGKIKEALKTKQILPTNMERARAFSKQISSTGGENLLMEPEEVDQLLQEAFAEDNIFDSSNLCVPGRVLCVYRKSTDKEADEDVPNYDVIVTDGGAKVLRSVAFSKTGISNHFLSAHRTSIDAILK